MKLSKTMKKFVAVVCTLALVVSSLAVNNLAKAADGSWEFTSTSYQTNAEKTQYNITVNYSAYQGANPDEYYYSVYVDEEADANIGIASNGWDWGKAQGRHGFDTVYKAKEGEAFKPGETHKIIVVAYQKNEDESFTRLDSIETEITLPAELPTLSQEEQEKKDLEDACASDANLAKGTTGFVSWNEEPAPALVDGNIGSGTGNSSVKGENDFVGVNLGEVKTIGSIITKFESACPAEFAVYVAGADGVYGDTPVATNTATGANPIVKTTFAAVEAQYVKVVQTVASELSAMYGMNAFELAVFAGEKTPDESDTTPAETDTTPAETDTTPAETDTTPAETDTTPTVEKPAAPAGLVHAPAADGTLPFHFAWAPSEGVTSYKVYLNDEYVAEVTTQDYNFDEALFAEAGEYTIAVTAVKDGVESDKTTVTYTVQGADPETTPADPETTPAETDTTPAETDTTPAETDTTPAETDTTPAETDTTPVAVETTTPAVVETTTPAATTVAPTTTTVAPKTTAAKKLGKTTVKVASKKKAATKVKITFKKVKGAKKYQVQIAKNKKFKKVLVKKTVKKAKVTIKSKKIKNQKKLFVRVRAVGAEKWSKPKKIKIKK